MSRVMRRGRVRAFGNGFGRPQAKVTCRDQDQSGYNAVGKVAENYRKNPAKSARMQSVMCGTHFPDKRGDHKANKCRNVTAQTRNFERGVAGRTIETTRTSKNFRRRSRCKAIWTLAGHRVLQTRETIPGALHV